MIIFRLDTQLYKEHAQEAILELWGHCLAKERVLTIKMSSMATLLSMRLLGRVSVNQCQRSVKQKLMFIWRTEEGSPPCTWVVRMVIIRAAEYYFSMAAGPMLKIMWEFKLVYGLQQKVLISKSSEAAMAIFSVCIKIDFKAFEVSS